MLIPGQALLKCDYKTASMLSFMFLYKNRCTDSAQGQITRIDISSPVNDECGCDSFIDK